MLRFKKLRKYQEGRKSKRSENIPRAQAPRWPHRPVGCRPPEVRTRFRLPSPLAPERAALGSASEEA